jgi:hypothetical protein
MLRTKPILPSGNQTGLASAAVFRVNRRRPVPSAFIT